MWVSVGLHPGVSQTIPWEAWYRCMDNEHKYVGFGIVIIVAMTVNSFTKMHKDAQGWGILTWVSALLSL